MAEEDNKERRAEELDALRSFYGDDLLCDGDDRWNVRVSRDITLQIRFTSNYPSAAAPIPKLVAPAWALDEGRKADVLKELYEMCMPDTEMGILWAEHCRSALGGDDADNIEEGNRNHEPKESSSSSSDTAAPQHAIVAVIDFHHMLVGQSHKKEAMALSAAPSHGVQGYIFMGGPSSAVVKTMHNEDMINWLQECKKAGKPGNIGYWKSVSSQDTPADWPTNSK